VPVSLYDHTARGLDGREVRFADFTGKVLLVVNVASKCGFTPQYEGLEALYRAYRDRGFVLLGFPCNQFGAQEPGDAEEIRTFCSMTYDVDFPMFAKVDVNGPEAHPIYAYLKHAKPGLFGSEAIKWNFTKFLVDRQGQVVKRFAPSARPETLKPAIERLL
jgi:glutathione peroxidase